jgi:serine/threonine protein kinase
MKKTPGDFIVDFYDAFSNIEEGRVALMMEYMDGGSLQDIVEHGGCDDEGTLASIALQALYGLAFLHSCQQLHRDLKPANFLISHQGDVKIADLGIMKQLDNTSSSNEDVSLNPNIPTIGNPHARSRSNSVSISYANYLKKNQTGASSMVISASNPTGIAEDSGSGETLGMFSPAGKNFERKVKEGEEPFVNPLLLVSSPKGIEPILQPGSLLGVQHPATGNNPALPPRKRSVSMALGGANTQGRRGTGTIMDLLSPSKLSGLEAQNFTGAVKSLPRTHTFVGTATYMSPERIDGKDYSFPSDIWGLGLSLLTVALGRLPFDTSGGYWSLLTSIRDESLLTYLPPHYSAEFRDFLACTLDRNPDLRSSALQLLKHPFVMKGSATATSSMNHTMNSIARSRTGSVTSATVQGLESSEPHHTNNTHENDILRGRKEFQAILQAIYQHIQR